MIVLCGIVRFPSHKIMLPGLRGFLFSVGGPVVRTAKDSSVRVLLRMVRLNPRSIVE